MKTSFQTISKLIPWGLLIALIVLGAFQTKAQITHKQIWTGEWRPNGTGPNPAGLDTAVLPLVPERFGSIAIGDIDADGDQDFISGSNRGIFFLFENTGTPTAPHWARVTGKIPSLDTIDIGFLQNTNEVRPTLVDIDADGDLDLFAGSRWNYPGFHKLDDLHFFRNTGTPTNAIFTYDTLPGLAWNQVGEFSKMAFADLDNDGDLDFMTGGSDSAVHFVNTGTATNPIFERQPEATSLFPRSQWVEVSFLAPTCDFEDFDQDGDFDLYFMNEAGFIRYIPNNGTATNPDFSPYISYPTPSLDTVDFGAFGAMDFEDVNGDGVKDLIASHWNPTRWYWYSGVSLGPSISATTMDISCNGLSDGSIKATVSGAVGPATYLWSTGNTTDSIGNLVAGDYTLTVTDSLGETTNRTISITEPAVLMASLASTDIDCNGFNNGSITATPAGGTTPYTYAWSNAATTASISSLAAGTYTLTLTDANGCTTTTSGTINEPAALVASTTLDANDAGGNTGAATASASGGTTPYTYAWSNSATSASITNLAAGTYSVTITDANSCTDSASVTIAAGPSVSIAIDSTVTCFGFSDGGATASGTGGTMPYTFAWSNSATTASITGVTSATYTITLTDNNGLTASTSAFISEPTVVTATSTVSANVSCNGGANGAIINNGAGGTGSYSYLWNNGDTTANISSLTAGSYTVTITDGNGCTVTNTETVTEPTAVVASIALDSNDMGNGGGATASATGGNSPYTYLWSNGGTSASIAGVAAGTYNTTVTDNNGCTDTETITITAGPVISMQVDSNVSCNGFLDGGATANVSAGNPPYTYLWSNAATTASITGVAAGTYTITVTDNIGLTETDMIIITEPAALVAASIIDSNVSCNTFSDGGATASATGGTAPYTYQWSNTAVTASITGVTAGTYSVTVTDANGCTDSSSTTITEPSALMAATIVDSNVSCNTFSDGGATASATGGTMPYTFAWSNSATTASITGVVAGTYTVTVSDNNGCSSITSATITEPNALMASHVVDNNVSCNGLSDGGATVSATGGTMPYTYAWSNSATTASISNVVAGTYSATITDNNGCTATTSASISEPAVLIAAAALDSNASCNGFNDGGATASATGGTMPYTFAWSNSATTASITGVANAAYQVTVTDANGCTDSASVVVGISDVTAPTVIAQNINLYLDPNGFASITTADIDNGSNDACGIQSLSLDSTNFDCSKVGANTVVLTVTDVNGNADTAHAVVTVWDTIKPLVITQNINVYLDANGMATINGGDIDNGTIDNCGLQFGSLDSTNFDCSEVGPNTVQLRVIDVNNNIDSASAVVTVIDTIKPNVSTQNISVYLDANGQASITTADIDNGSSDACGIQMMSLDDSNFDCSEVGANTVTLTVTDVNNNVESATATVTVIDTVKPNVVSQNINLYLDANGLASISTADIDNGSTDACGIQSLSLDSTNFDCSEVGANTVTLTVTDVNNNVDAATATVTVIDTVKPQVITQNINLYLDPNGAASITTTDIDNGSNDACGIQSLSLDLTSFDCSTIGANTVTLSVTDVNNNLATATATVTVIDTFKAIVVTQDITVYLDANGQATISTADIDNGSNDACGVQSLSLDSTNFDCSEVDTNTVTLTVTDVNNNVSSATAVVTVEDTISPTVITQNLTVYLDANGLASITTADIDNGSSDNCSIQMMSLDSSNFDCSETGANTVTLSVTDVNTNVNTATAVVTVLDTIRPSINACPANITVTADAGVCTAVVNWSNPTASDNCSIDSLVTNFNPGHAFPIGTTEVVYIAYDASSNTDTCRFTVTVNDNEDPVIANVPADITVNNDLGDCGAVVNWTDATATDNCALDSLRSDFNSGATFPVGTTTVTYTAYDASMNTAMASFTITVIDNELPVITCPANIAQCDSVVTFSDATATDNCGIASIVRTDNTGLNSGDQFPIGTTTLSYRVTDIHGNQADCSFDVLVYTPPTANAGPDLETRDIEPVQIQGSSTNAASFSWTPSASLIDARVEQPIANPQLTTTYQMEVTSPDGCIVTDEMEIVVNVVNNLDATTLFSPNGDGMNDTWVVNKPALIQGCRLIIVNRNGTEVYSTSNYNNEWDGTVNGTNLPEGTYYYIFDCPDGRTLNGPITILRERR